MLPASPVRDKSRDKSTGTMDRPENKLNEVFLEGILKRRKTRSEVETELKNIKKAREAPGNAVKVTKSGKILTGVTRASPVRNASPPPQAQPRQIVVQSKRKKLTITIRNQQDRQREIEENPKLQDAWGNDEPSPTTKRSRSRETRKKKKAASPSHSPSRSPSRSRSSPDRSSPSRSPPSRKSSPRNKKQPPSKARRGEEQSRKGRETL